MKYNEIIFIRYTITFNLFFISEIKAYGNCDYTILFYSYNLHRINFWFFLSCWLIQWFPSEIYLVGYIIALNSSYIFLVISETNACSIYYKILFYSYTMTCIILKTLPFQFSFDLKFFLQLITFRFFPLCWFVQWLTPKTISFSYTISFSVFFIYEPNV